MVQQMSQETDNAVRLELSVPCDERFYGLLEAVSRRMAAYIGYAAADVETVARSVLAASGGLLGGGATGAYASLDLTFATRGLDMEIVLRYVPRDADALPPPRAMEQALGAGEAGRAPLDLLRSTMGSVTFGNRGGAEFCRLTRPLPVD